MRLAINDRRRPPSAGQPGPRPGSSSPTRCRTRTGPSRVAVADRSAARCRGEVKSRPVANDAETQRKLEYSRIPFIAAIGRGLRTALTRPLIGASLNPPVKSTIDRSASARASPCPSSLPLRCGSTMPTGRAAPVVVGMMLQRRRGAPRILVRHRRPAAGRSCSVNRDHCPSLDAEAVVEDLHERREAVGGARRVRHQGRCSAGAARCR